MDLNPRRTNGRDHTEMAAVGERRLRWQRQCRLPAPLTIGRPPRVIGDIIDRTVQEARVGALTGAEALALPRLLPTARPSQPTRRSWHASTASPLWSAPTTQPCA